VLRILRGAGPEGLPTLEIAERMIEQAPGITRLLDRLEAKGLVARRRCLEDRRQVLCTISRSGLSVLEELDPPIRAMDEEALGMLSRADLESLIRSLDEIRAPNRREPQTPKTKKQNTTRQNNEQKHKGQKKSTGLKLKN
jgi:DNA-binding MarR family transcriptional regulator